MSQSFSLAFPYGPVPVTGSPLFLSSSSITFHLPTHTSLSIGVTLLPYTFTLGRFSSSPPRPRGDWISSSTLRGFAGPVSLARRCCAVRRGANFASGRRWPVSW